MSNNLTEMQTYTGGFDTNALQHFYKFIFITFDNDKDKVTKLVKRFIKEQLASSTKKVTDSGIWSYIHRLSIGGRDLSSYPKFLKKTSTHGSLSYFLASNLLQLKESYGLSYFRYKERSFHKYFFFDSEIEEFVGLLEVSETLTLPYNSYKVVLSAVEKEYIGRGYGSKMYLTVLNNVDYLKSDQSLYSDSLNIWVNFLPKMVNTWAKLYDDKIPVKTDLKSHINPELVDYYFASKIRNSPPSKLI
jgi:hypothetical protein